MGQIRHGSATTTHIVRAATQRSQVEDLPAIGSRAGLRARAAELGAGHQSQALLDPALSARFSHVDDVKVLLAERYRERQNQRNTALQQRRTEVEDLAATGDGNASLLARLLAQKESDADRRFDNAHLYEALESRRSKSGEEWSGASMVETFTAILADLARGDETEQPSEETLLDRLQQYLDDYSGREGSFARLMYGATGAQARRNLQSAFNRQHANPRVLLPEHIRRRISYSLEMRLPPESARRVIWRRLALAGHSDFPAEMIGRLAQDHPVASAVLKNALRVATLSGGGIDNAELALGAARGLIEGALPPANASALFEPALTRTDLDLEALILRLKTVGGRPVSLCLSGPVGTGKSAFARHLAAEMGLEVIQKRASELLSCWVGQSEQNIAAAFAEARARRAFLIFDEADSLLADREDARQSWEVSQVNEMLTWMESHPLPFACTTNLIDRLERECVRNAAHMLPFSSHTVQTH